MSPIRKHPRKYQYFDLTLVSGIVATEPKIKTSTGGHNYASFTLGIKFEKNGRKTYKNFRVSAYDELANEILALVHKSDNILVYGRVMPYIYNTRSGESGAGLFLNMIKWKKNPDSEDIKGAYKNLETIGFEESDEEYEVDEGNEEELF